MHRMHRVNNIVACLVVLMGAHLGAYCQSKGDRVLDLTQKSNADHKSMGVPGNRVAIYRDQQSASVTLPLDISVERAEVESSASAVVRVKIFNHGMSAFEVPSCTDEVRAHRQGSKGRHTLQFSLEFLDSKLKKIESQLAEVTFGSLSDRECMSMLAPGASMVVLFRTILPTKTSEVLENNAEVHVNASITQLELSDTSFSVARTSPPVQSGVAVVLRH